MKKVLLIIIAFIVIVGGAFYGGMEYTQSKTPQGFAQDDFEDMRNLSPEERQQRFQQAGVAGMMGMTGLRNGRSGGGTDSDFATGEIISKDNQSVTIKLRDGGSKIVFYSDATEVGKFVNGTSDDLEVERTIIVNGKSNQDGSITAGSIQIRNHETPTQ